MNRFERRLVTSLIVALTVLCTSSPGTAQDAAAAPAAAPQIRIGILGLDTSHVIAFTRLFNDPKAEGDLALMRVVAGYPGGTDIPSSKNRVAGFTGQLAGMGVEIIDSIPKLLKRVDVVLLECVDGRPHLDQVRLVFAAGKRVFIDKPLAGSLADVVAIEALGREHKVPWWSSSSLRFGAPVPKRVGKVLGCASWGPCSLESTHPDLFWYGIHGVEALFTIMGVGCERVSRVQTAGFEHVTGVWKDGRIGTFRGIREGKTGFGAMAFGAKGIAKRPKYPGYGPLVLEIARFFRTGQPPVPNQETLEIYAFMAAADESKRRMGAPVSVRQSLDRAREELARRRR